MMFSGRENYVSSIGKYCFLFEKSILPKKTNNRKHYLNECYMPDYTQLLFTNKGHLLQNKGRLFPNKEPLL